MRRIDHRAAGFAVAIAAAAALVVAEGAQHWLGLVPCALCLLERWPWRLAVVLGIVASLTRPREAGRGVLVLLALCLLASTALAFVHVGVERGLWPSPLPECAAPELHGTSLAQLLASMPARPSKPCDAPSFLIPGLPLSMAAMNLLYALVVLGLLVAYLARSGGEAR
ncbi:MAG TPA: disulfide bond formation protein B [Acetobacteraceae bacterium]|nr:disulfide bond formation protein B [Acetobacteraceae bacterium]